MVIKRIADLAGLAPPRARQHRQRHPFAPASPTHLPLENRRDLHAGEKDRLGALAAPLIKPGMVVILDGGTTHLALIRHLPPNLAATVVTHSPTIAAALEPFAALEVIVIGGRLLRHSMVALGPAAYEGFARLRADLCLLGVTGLHPEAGLTTGDHDEARIKARMLESASETVVLATADKLGTASPHQIAPLSALTRLIALDTPDWAPKPLTI